MYEKICINILISGGVGFIGGHLAEDNHDIVMFDNFEPYYDFGIKEHNMGVGRSATASSSGSYEFVRESTTDMELVDDTGISVWSLETHC